MTQKDTNLKRLVHLDEKVLKPADKIKAGGSNLVDKGMPSRDALQKSMVGKPRVYDLKGNLLADEENLVVLVGREYLAQLLAMRPPVGYPAAPCPNGTPPGNACNYTDYRVTHFGVGDGGTSNDCPPQTIGPFDNDVDLVNRVKIKDPLAGGDEPNYIDGGNLKRIEQIDDQGNVTEGSISVEIEEHTINTIDGGQQVVDAFTAVKYVMYLQPDEAPKDDPNHMGYFKFNEAGLYAVRHVDDGNGNMVPTNDYILFARFTTLDKYLETTDGIMIEWYILV